MQLLYKYNTYTKLIKSEFPMQHPQYILSDSGNDNQFPPQNEVADNQLDAN